MDEIIKNREFMKCPDFNGETPEKSDQKSGVPAPPKGLVKGGRKIALPPFSPGSISDSYYNLTLNRRSERLYSKNPATAEQLAFILWSAQGALRDDADKPWSLRPVPSGGARHAFETYIFVKNVTGLEQGLYHYLPFENVGVEKSTIEFIRSTDGLSLTDMLAGQSWAEKAAFTLFFTCVPYRAEWRYRENAHRVMLIDLGHVGQNITLSATATGLGSCCLAAFSNAECDKALQTNGRDEYTAYAITVGAKRFAA